MDVFIYKKNRSTSEAIFWKCSEYRVSKCQSRLVMRKNSLKKNVYEHNHQPNYEKINHVLQYDTITPYNEDTFNNIMKKND